jgi:hypothetical protein
MCDEFERALADAQKVGKQEFEDNQADAQSSKKLTI